MKYWKDTDIEHIEYEEGGCTLPHNKPASIATSDTMRVETEIIPNTAQVRKYVNSYTFEMDEGMCVDVERRIWRGNSPMHLEVIFVPLSAFGYDKEPNNHDVAFDDAMKII